MFRLETPADPCCMSRRYLRGVQYGDPDDAPMRRAVTLLGGGLAYLLAGLVAWWHVWSDGASHTIAAQGWGDPAQQVWYLGWVPHALGAGIDPLVSHAMFAPAASTSWPTRASCSRRCSCHR